MSTEASTLPVLDCLDMGVALCRVQAVRCPRPVYEVAFRLHLRNAGTGSVRLMGRKWTLRDRNGATRIIEAANVFNQQPVLPPGGVFGYGGKQSFDSPPAAMELRLFGSDARNQPFISPPLVFPRQCLHTPY